MRIHSNTLTALDIFEAERISRTDATWSVHDSRIRERGWDVSLLGESHRRPNNRGRYYSDEYAATWDQWGVFLAVLFDRDPGAVCGSGLRYAVYVGRRHFHDSTFDRFRPVGITTSDSPGAIAVRGDSYDGTHGVVYRSERTYWPSDYHGDHTWRLNHCTKCSAARGWVPRVEGFDCESEDFALDDCKHWGKPGTDCSGPRVGRVIADGTILCEGHYNQQPTLRLVG